MDPRVRRDDSFGICARFHAYAQAHFHVYAQLRFHTQVQLRFHAHACSFVHAVTMVLVRAPMVSIEVTITSPG